MKTSRPALGAITAVTVLVILMGVVYCVLSSYITSRQIRETQKATRSTISVIQDCTTPGGKCYQRTQRQTRGVVDSINEVSVYAATCAKRYGTVSRIESCVLAFLHDRPQPKLDRGKAVAPSTPRATSPAKVVRPKGDRGARPTSPSPTHPAPSPPPSTKPTKPPKPPAPTGPPTITLPVPTPLCVLHIVCVKS